MVFFLNPYRFGPEYQPTAYETAVLSDNPLIFTPYSDTSGTTAKDLSSNRINTPGGGITWGGSSLTTETKGSAIFTSNGTDRSSFEFDSSLANRQTFSIEAWIRPTTLNNSSYGGGHGISIFNNSPGGSQPPSGSEGYCFGVNNSGALWFWYLANQDLLSSNGIVSVNNNYHIVATLGSGNLKLYCNNSLVASKTGVVINPSSYNIVDIGGRSWIVGWMTGLMQNFAYYTTELSASRISNYYSVGTT